MPIALINQENMGRLNRIQYRVETPFKNGNLDHLFADKAQAVEYADKGANEFGLAILFDHLTNEIMHISCHRIKFGENAKQFDYTGDIKFKTTPCPTNWLDEEANK